MIQDLIFLLSKFNRYVSIIEATVLIFTTSLLYFFQIGWGIVVMRNIKLYSRSQRRLVGETYSKFHFELCHRKITQGKLLLTILSLEFISGNTFCLGYLYPHLFRIIPFLNAATLHFNTTCIAQIEEHRHWVRELEYPVVALLQNIGRVSFILGMGVAISFFQFITNTYVNDLWRIKHVYRCIWYTSILVLVLFALGVLPYTMLVGRILIVITFGVYYIRLVKQTIILRKAMKWGEQDLYHNCEIELLKRHKKQYRYFSVTSKCVGVAILLYGLADAGQVMEIIITVFLYYGKCIFPFLFHFQYHTLLTAQQLPYLNLALIISADVEKILNTIATCVLSFQYIALTIVLIITRKRTVYHYPIHKYYLHYKLNPKCKS